MRFFLSPASAGPAAIRSISSFRFPYEPAV